MTSVSPEPPPISRFISDFASVAPLAIEGAQRDRVADSVAATAAERDFAGASVERILRHAHMSVRTFKTLFDGRSREEFFLASYHILAARLGADLEAAWAGGGEWAERVRAAIADALAFAAEHPDQARLLFSGILAAGAEAVAAQAQSIEALAAKLREGRGHYPAAAPLNRHTERVIVAGLVALVGERLLAGGADALPSLVPELTEVALTPYLGLAEARRLARA